MEVSAHNTCARKGVCTRGMDQSDDRSLHGLGIQIMTFDADDLETFVFQYNERAKLETILYEFRLVYGIQTRE